MSMQVDDSGSENQPVGGNGLVRRTVHAADGDDAIAVDGHHVAATGIGCPHDAADRRIWLA